MAAARILVVEDEKALLKVLRYNLEREGYRVSTASDGPAAIETARRERPDLVLLDVMLPGFDGFEVLKQLRRTSQVPVLFLSARREELDRVLGLELGGDDYLTKPFSLRELMARVKALLKRAGAAPASEARRWGALEADFERHEVRVGGAEVKLTSAEFSLLKLLVEADGKPLSRDAVLESLHGPDRSYELDARGVDQLVARLREKLGAEAGRVATVKNVGYRFKAG
ncbi:MAG: response regulator transcription factor [Elusimicrobia bacterium]|nr:response regulator transcription factor [Elusimicrobiota bacterium]